MVFSDIIINIYISTDKYYSFVIITTKMSYNTNTNTNINNTISMITDITTITNTTITNTTTTNTTTTNPINMNHQIRNDEWVEFEKSPGKGSEAILNCLAGYVSRIVRGEEDVKSVQLTYPTTFPEGFDNYRRTVGDKKKKTKGFADMYDVNVDLTIEYKSEIEMKKKIDKMKFDNSVKSYKDDLKLVEEHTQNTIHIPTPVGLGLVDIKVLELVNFMNTLIQTPKRKVDMGTAYEAFFGIGKILQSIKDIEVKHHTTGAITKVHDMIVKPLELKYQHFVQHFNFDYSVASSQYPRLFYSTGFDKIFPGMSVKPYESQKQMLDFVSENFNRPFMCVMNTLMGMGKTWVAGYIGLLVHLTNIKRNGSRQEPKTMIYTCPETLKSVRHIVGRILHYHDVPFAVAFIEAGRVVIKKQNSSKGDRKKPTVILAGVQATIELLKTDYIHKDKKDLFIMKKSDLLVFFDENTIQMDKQPSPMVPYLTEFYHHLPPQTIFSSATHPDVEDMVELRNYAKAKYEGIIFRTLDYSRVLIGTQLNKLNGQMFIPHSGCVDSSSLARFIEFVESNLMYKKFYTIPLVRAIYEKIVELRLELPEELKFARWMDVFEHRNQESVQNLGINYLKFIHTLSSTDSTVLARFNAIEKTNQGINFDDLIASSRTLSGQTFISCANPEALMDAKFGAHFQSAMASLGIKSFEELNERYKRQKELQEKKTQSAAKAKATRGDERITRLERARVEGEISSDMTIPEIPVEFRLGASKTSISIGSKNWDDVIASDLVKFAALFGIFIYSEESHHTYNDFVIDVISRGSAVYVFADSTLNYGNSFPFNNGIITDDMAIHSDKTLLQLMARAGRPGVSHTAIIYAGESVLARIQDAIYNLNYTDFESSNLNLCVELAQKLVVQEQLRQEQEEQQAIFREEQSRLRAEQARLRAEQEAEQEAERSRLRAEQEAEHARLRAEQDAQLNSRWGRQRAFESRESRSEDTRRNQTQNSSSNSTSSSLNWTRGQRL